MTITQANTTTIIPGTDFEIFPLNLGTNPFGWTSDEGDSFRVLDAFVEGGGNFVDTADSYSMWAPGNSGGESEAILGKWIASRGKNVIVATKSGGLAPVDGRSRANTEAAVEASLRRLELDSIDIFYYHYDDESVAIDEQVAIAQDLVEAGKIRHLALSNYTPERMREFLTTAQGTTAQPVAIQPQYNLIHRQAYEIGYRPLADEFGVAVFPYFALASGVLTGKYRSEADLAGRARQGFAQGTVTQDSLRVVEELVRVARTRGAEPSTVALAWLLANGVTAPIASVSTPEQLPSLMAAPALELSADDVAALDKASAPFA